MLLSVAAGFVPASPARQMLARRSRRCPRAGPRPARNRPDAPQWAARYAELAPNYRAVSESYKKAQEVAREPKQ